ncbi:MAG: PD-(D/E)XK nuclease family protein [FCB group bacterium]|nr:PD-(D/E)XK nuclease family protein [FCB group bacterium]
MNLRISPTQVSMFFGCAAAYYQRYILGRKIPPGIALAMGTGLDEAANVNFIQKQATRKDLPLDMFEDAAATAFTERVRKEGLLLTKENASRSEQFIAESKDKTVELARKLGESVAPLIQPVAVQTTIEFIRDANPEVIHTGKIDVLDETHDVIDVKSSKNRWSKVKATAQVQPTFYIPGVKETLNASPKRFVYHIITKAKKPVHQMVETFRDESDLIELDYRIEIIVKMRKAGLFQPCDPDHWRCSPEWCAFYLAGCKYISTRKKITYINREV